MLEARACFLDCARGQASGCALEGERGGYLGGNDGGIHVEHPVHVVAEADLDLLVACWAGRNAEQCVLSQLLIAITQRVLMPARCFGSALGAVHGQRSRAHGLPPRLARRSPLAW